MHAWPGIVLVIILAAAQRIYMPLFFSFRWGEPDELSGQINLANVLRADQADQTPPGCPMQSVWHGSSSWQSTSAHSASGRARHVDDEVSETITY